MAKTFAQLQAEAEAIRTNVLPESNTAGLVGGFLRDALAYFQAQNDLVNTEISNALLKTAEMADINTLKEPGYYQIMNDGATVGCLSVVRDALDNSVTHCLMTNYRCKNGSIVWTKLDPAINVLTRSCASGRWSGWVYQHETFMVNLSLEEYEDLVATDSVDDKLYYFIYEEE